jgi:hypothetical protein
MKTSTITRALALIVIIAYGIAPTIEKLIVFGVVTLCAELQRIEEKL